MDKQQKLVIARRYRKYIKDLEKQQDKFYLAALEELKITNTDWAFDYFFGNHTSTKEMFEAGNAKEV
jgi:hypothetical protein